MEHFKVYNTFQFKEQVTLSEARTQQLIIEQIERLKQLADTYNLHGHPLTLRLFGDLKSGLGFKIECSDLNVQQSVSKALKMYLSSCQD